MKKVIKLIILVFAAIVILFIGFGLFYYSPVLSMNVTETGQISGTNIYAVKSGMGNLFLVKTDSGFIMIDAGMDSKALAKSLKEAGIDANEIKWIFLTHSDSDHAGTLPLFPNAEIYMSEDEFPLINGTVNRFAFVKNSLPSGIDIKKITLLKNDQKLLFGGTEIACIKAPGHTDGSMLYLTDGKYLFTGDAFKIKEGIAFVHPFTKDSKLSKETIERLKGICDSSAVVLTSHYGFFR